MHRMSFGCLPLVPLTSNGSLSARIIPWSLEGFTRQRFHSCLLLWFSHGLHGWRKMGDLSSHLYLLCKLSRKVKLHCIKLSCMLISLNKILIATIRDKDDCPCPHCLIPKQYLCGLGTTSIPNTTHWAAPPWHLTALVNTVEGCVCVNNIGWKRY